MSDRVMSGLSGREEYALRTVDGRMVCPDCGSSSYLVVNGREMTYDDLLHLRYAPKKIELRLPHALWCPSEQNRMQVLHLTLTPPHTVDRADDPTAHSAEDRT